MHRPYDGFPCTTTTASCCGAGGLPAPLTRCPPSRAARIAFGRSAELAPMPTTSRSTTGPSSISRRRTASWCRDDRTARNAPTLPSSATRSIERQERCWIAELGASDDRAGPDIGSPRGQRLARSRQLRPSIRSGCERRSGSLLATESSAPADRRPTTRGASAARRPKRARSATHHATGPGSRRTRSLGTCR